VTAPPAAATSWLRTAERGSAFGLRLMIAVCGLLGRGFTRLLLAPIVFYFVLLAPQARRASRDYLRRIGKPYGFWGVYAHFLRFAHVTLDRLFFVLGRHRSFAIERHGKEHLIALKQERRGALLLGAHLGSFEALHAVGAGRPGLRVAMAMFPDNARMIHETLRTIAPNFHLDIITIGRSHSTLAVRDWLDGGGLVGLLGDRVLGTEGPRANFVVLPFLGHAARFSDGPLRLAMLLRRRVVFMAALYRGGGHYDVRFEPLADFTRPSSDPVQRDNRLHDALQAYVQRLEALCRESPYNWFNFFDFWHEDGP